MAAISARFILRRSFTCLIAHHTKYHTSRPLFLRGTRNLISDSLEPHVSSNERELDVPPNEREVDVSPNMSIEVNPSELKPAKSYWDRVREEQDDEITLEKFNITEPDTTSEPLRDADPEFIDEMKPELPVSFNIASFIDRNQTLQELVKLGVDLSKVERARDFVEFLLRADFKRDIAPYIRFLVDLGLHPSDLGNFITKNPAIFQELFENLETRIDYLRSKKFSRKQIVQIVKDHPSFLCKSVKEVDSRLGFLQQEYKLEAPGVRYLLTMFPKIVSYDNMGLRLRTYAIKDDMGFTEEQVKKMIMEAPSLLGADRVSMVRIFDHLHNYGRIDQEIMVYFPEVFTGELRTVKHRLEYLRKLRRAQFNPAKPRFVPLTVLAHGDDELFATKYAGTNLDDYNYFLKCQ